jgi:hypothetical protein
MMWTSRGDMTDPHALVGVMCRMGQHRQCEFVLCLCPCDPYHTSLNQLIRAFNLERSPKVG